MASPHRKGLGSAALSLLAAAQSVPAHAQAPAAPQLETLPVYQMARPFYDPPGLKLGTFLLFPTASEQMGYDDNIFVSDRRRASDLVNTTSEALSIASQWARHSLSAHFLAGQELYARHSSNNANSWGADASGRLDITDDARFQLDGGFIQQPLGRGTAEAGEEPKRPLFNTTDLTAAYVQRDAPLANRLEFSMRDIAYVSDGNAARSGTRFSYRDRVSYDVSSNVSLFVEAGFAQQHWLRRPELRNFDLLTGLLGVSVDIPSTIHAEFGAGVLRQSYRDGDFETLVAPTAHERLIWNVLPLTSIIATVDRTVFGTETFCDPAVSTCVGGSGSLLPGDPSLAPKRNSLQVTSAEIGVQHEIFHDILGEASFRYERDHFDFNGLTDRIYALRANIRYLINRYLEADLDYTYRDRTANLPNDRTFNSGPFNENVVSLSLKAGL